MVRYKNPRLLELQVASVIRYLAQHATEENGKSQADIAAYLECSISTVSRILTAYPKLFPIARYPLKPRCYFWDATANSPVAADLRPSQANIPPGAIDMDQLAVISKMSREELLGKLMTNTTLDILEKLTAALNYALKKQLYNSWAIQETDMDVDTKNLLLIEQLLEAIPENLAVLAGIHAKLGSDKRWGTGEAWRIFYLKDWQDLNEGKH